MIIFSALHNRKKILFFCTHHTSQIHIEDVIIILLTKKIGGTFRWRSRFTRVVRGFRARRFFKHSYLRVVLLLMLLLSVYLYGVYTLIEYE